MSTWIYNDGGRKAAGYKGVCGNCAIRAIAIAAELPYRDVYESLQMLQSDLRPRGGRKVRSVRSGTEDRAFRLYMNGIGWTWTPTMLVGQGCKVHLRAEELPGGRIIARVSKHWAAVIDGVVHDTHDSTRNGKRCVYGYWKGTTQ